MYNYQTERAKLFTERGMTLFVKVRDLALELLETQNSFIGEDIRVSNCDSWTIQACIDYLVERGEIQHSGNHGPFLQHTRYIRG